MTPTGNNVLKLADNSGHISQAKLKSILEYDSDSGKFFWKSRARDQFSSDRAFSIFKARYSGKPAGNLNKHINYFQIRIAGRLYKRSRLAWLYVYGEVPNVIDHIDFNKSNDRISNLRNGSKSDNQRNLRLRPDSLTGIPGVNFKRKQARWVARINVDCEAIHLGTFRELFEACCARKAAENKFGFDLNHGTSRPVEVHLPQ